MGAIFVDADQFTSDLNYNTNLNEVSKYEYLK